MRDYSDYDGVSNSERAVHLVAMRLGFLTTMTKAMCPTRHGFQLYWDPPINNGRTHTRARAHVSCDWKSWLPAEIREALDRRLSAYEAACAGPYGPASFAVSDAETDKIANWLRETHPAILVDNDGPRYLR